MPLILYPLIILIVMFSGALVYDRRRRRISSHDSDRAARIARVDSEARKWGRPGY